MGRFEDGYDSAIHFPGSNGPPVSLRETTEMFERDLPERNRQLYNLSQQVPLNSIHIQEAACMPNA